MSLKFKRNAPLVTLLVGILCLLSLTLGSQPIVAYTVNTQGLQTLQLTAVSADLAQWANTFGAQLTAIDSQLHAVQP